MSELSTADGSEGYEVRDDVRTTKAGCRPSRRTIAKAPKIPAVRLVSPCLSMVYLFANRQRLFKHRGELLGAGV